MIADFKKYRSGKLEIHPDFPKFLTNPKENILREIEIDGTHVEILPPEGTVKYLDQETKIRCCLVRIRQT